MKHHRNRSKCKRQLFEAVLSKWYWKNVSFQIRFRSSLTKSVVINSISAAAILGMSMTSWSKDDPALMPEVVVSGRQAKEKKAYKPETLSSPKYTEPLRDVSQTITIISQDVMQAQGASSLRDVLRDVPGISIQAGEGGVPAGDNLSIRGFSARTDMFIDGVRDFGGYSRDPFNFDQVEVAKGPSSSFAGRGSTGGSINMVSKAPELERSYSGTISEGTDQYQRYTLDINQPIQGVNGAAFRLNSMYHDADVPGRDLVHNERWGIAPTLSFGLESDTRVTLGYFHLAQDNIPDYGIPWIPNTNVPLSAYQNKVAPVDWGNFYGLKNRDYEKTVTDLFTVKAEHDFNDSLSVRNQLRLGQTLRDSIVTSPRFASTTSTDITRTDWKSRDQIDTILANQTDFTVKFATAQIEHTLVPGIEFTQEKNVSYTRTKDGTPGNTGSNSSNTSLYIPNWEDPYLENIRRNGAETNTNSSGIALYIFDTAKLNEQWQLNGGLRWDYFNTDYLSAPAPAPGALTNLGRIDRVLSGKVGVVYKPVEQGSIYAAYGTSFNPSAEGLALSSTASADTNLNLDPETSRTYELGTKWDLMKEKLSLNAAIFRTDKLNARTTDPGANAGSTTDDIRVTEGTQRVQGFELGASGSITDHWKTFAAYTFMDSEVLKSQTIGEQGNELGNTPHHTFSLWSVYELPKNFEIGSGLKYVDTRFNASTNNSREVPGYMVADAMLAYKFNKNMTLRLNVYNLADAEYIDSVGGGHSIPGAGRSAVVSSEFKF